MAGARARKLAGGWGRFLAIATLTAAMSSAWWLFAADLAPLAPPWKAPLLGLAPEPVSPVSDEFRRRIEDTTATVPESVWRALWEAGWRVQMAEFVVDAAPSLMGEQPRGWPNGLTWENTDAVNLPHRRLVVVAEKRRNRQGEIVPADRIEGVFRHELGHAYDRASGGKLPYQSSHPEFVAAYQLDLRAIADERRAELGYYLQGDAAGRQEAFAEAFAIVLGGGSDPAKRDTFRQAFPRVADYLAKTLAAGATITQTAGK